MRLRIRYKNKSGTFYVVLLVQLRMVWRAIPSAFALYPPPILCTVVG